MAAGYVTIEHREGNSPPQKVLYWSDDGTATGNLTPVSYVSNSSGGGGGTSSSVTINAGSAIIGKVGIDPANNIVSSTLNAGSAIVGKVGIDPANNGVSAVLGAGSAIVGKVGIDPANNGVSAVLGAGSAIVGKVGIDPSSNGVISTPVDATTITCTPVSALNGVIFSVDTTNYGSVAVSFSGTWSATNTIQVSDDNTNWNPGSGLSSTGSVITGSSNNGTSIIIPAQHRYVRVIAGSYTSGTINAVAYLRKDTVNILSGMTVNGGNVASGVADAGSPVKVGGVYRATLPTYTDGQRGDLGIGNRGALNVTLFGNNSVNSPNIAAGADASANAFGMSVNSQGEVFNGTTWDRQRDTNSSNATSGTGLLGIGNLGWDSTNSLYRRMLTDVSGNLMIAPIDSLSVVCTSVSAQGGIIFSVDCTNYGGVGFTLTGTWSGTITAQASDDNVNWLSTGASTVNSAQSAFTTNGAGFIPAQHRYLRLVMTAYTSGTAGASATLRKDSGSFVTNMGVAGMVSSGSTDSGNPVKIGGVASSAIPTAVSTGQRINAWYGLNGQQVMSFAGVGTGDGQSQAGPTSLYDYGSTSSIRFLGAANMVWNGTSWNYVKKPNASSRLAATAATTNAALVKSTFGDVYKITAYNTTASVKYIKLYNKATAPVAGTDTPIAVEAIPPNARFDMTYPEPLYFSAGIGYAITGAAADSDTTATAAGDVVALNIYYQ